MPSFLVSLVFVAMRSSIRFLQTRLRFWVPPGRGVRYSGAGTTVTLIKIDVKLERYHRGDRIPFTHLHDAHALGGPGQGRNLGRGHANDLALLRDHHDLLGLVLLADKHLRPDDLTGLGGHLRGLDAGAAASLDLVLIERGLLTVSLVHHDEQRGIRCVRWDDLCRYDVVCRLEAHATHPGCRAAHGADLGLVEADGLALGRDYRNGIALARERRLDELVPLLEVDGDDARAAHVREVLGGPLLQDAGLRHEEYRERIARGTLRDRKHRGDLLVAGEREEVHDGLTLGGALTFRDLVHLQLVRLAVVGEEEELGVRGRGEEVRHDVLLLGRDVDDAHPATLLHLVLARVCALHVAAGSEHEDRFFVRH